MICNKAEWIVGVKLEKTFNLWTIEARVHS